MHLVSKLDHAALVGVDLGQVKRDVSIELVITTRGEHSKSRGPEEQCGVKLRRLVTLPRASLGFRPT